MHSNKFSTTILFITILALLTNLNAQQNEYVEKKGGICFRTDDTHPIADYNEYAQIFDKYNQKFTCAINFDYWRMNSSYIEQLKIIQNNGHEIMDHTPNHRTNYFVCKFLSPDFYIGHPGVERIVGNKVELKHAPIKLEEQTGSGFISVRGDTIIATNNDFANFTYPEIYIYAPKYNELVLLKKIINDSTAIITDLWDNKVDYGKLENIKYYKFSKGNIHLTIDAIKALAQETLRLTEYWNLKRPYTWIQPGGQFISIDKIDLKKALLPLGFTSAGSYQSESRKVFNEYNPNDDNQFAMNWGSFMEDLWTLEKTKNVIADNIAKHRVLVGHSHFKTGELLGGWSGFLNRTDSLLQWAVEKNIPIKTYSAWTDILYNKTPNPYENIFPKINVDLDENNIPDGYILPAETKLDKSDNYTEDNYALSIKSPGYIFGIYNLGGLEKGKNDFYFWMKAPIGSKVLVNFQVGNKNLKYQYTSLSSDWKKYTLNDSENNVKIEIPVTISTINVIASCNNYISGEVKLSGFFFGKSEDSTDFNFELLSPKENDTVFVNNIYKIQWLSTNFADSVNIDLLRKNNYTNLYDTINIAKNIKNLNKFDWTIDLGLGQENRCKLLFKPSNNNNSNKYFISKEFMLKDITNYYFTLIPPENDGNLYVNNTYRIGWNTNFIGNVDIDLVAKISNINSYDTTNIAKNISEKYLDWSINLGLYESDSCKLLFRPTNPQSRDNYYLTGFFGIKDTTAPPATEISAIVNENNNYKISWNQSNANDIKYYAVYKSSNINNLNNPNCKYILISRDTLIIDRDIEQNKEYYYKIAVYDKNNNRSPFSSIKSTIMTDVENEPIIPTVLSLEQNYPNPFNPKTNIGFSIPKDNSSVTLRIYNNLGQLVATLLDKKLSSGKHNITFDASNLSSGIYIYSLQVGSKVLNKKLILLK